MLIEIDFETIFSIWKNKLWPERLSKIESTSAMNYLGGYNIKNMDYKPTFYGYLLDNKIVGVNSGHLCADQSYRSRGLFVDSEYRNRGIGKILLLASIDRGRFENANFVWSYPKHTAHNTYVGAGFAITSEWEQSELGRNAYCKIDLI